jgi:hypothetical protein
MVPALACPVPFWGCGFRPPPLTALRPFVKWVPCESQGRVRRLMMFDAIQRPLELLATCHGVLRQGHLMHPARSYVTCCAFALCQRTTLWRMSLRTSTPNMSAGTLVVPTCQSHKMSQAPGCIPI